MYNKDSLLEFLLAPPPSPDVPVSSRPFGGDGLLAAGHLRSLKDVQGLKLTPASSNGADSIASASNADRGGQVEFGKARWECPITMRGMTGAVKFVYVKGCGCVASEVGLKELAGVNLRSPEEDENGMKEARRAICPVCAAKLPGSKVEMVTLNPLGKEKEQITKAWAEKIIKEEKEKADRKAFKKNKKRKDVEGTENEGETKKLKLAYVSREHAPSINRKLPAMPESKKHMTEAIASLYAPKEGKGKLSALFSSGYSRMG